MPKNHPRRRTDIQRRQNRRTTEPGGLTARSQDVSRHDQSMPARCSHRPLTRMVCKSTVRAASEVWCLSFIYAATFPKLSFFFDGDSTMPRKPLHPHHTCGLLCQQSCKTDTFNGKTTNAAATEITSTVTTQTATMRCLGVNLSMVLCCH